MLAKAPKIPYFTSYNLQSLEGKYQLGGRFYVTSTMQYSVYD